MAALPGISACGRSGGESFNRDAGAGPFVGPLPPWDHFRRAQNAAPQLGTSNKVYLGDSRMLSVVYRNGAVWAAHPVFLPESAPTRSAVQWLQIDPASGDVLQGSRIDDGRRVASEVLRLSEHRRERDQRRVDRLLALLVAAVPERELFLSERFGCAEHVRDDRVLKAGAASYFKTER